MLKHTFLHWLRLFPSQRSRQRHPAASSPRRLHGYHPTFDRLEDRRLLSVSSTGDAPALMTLASDSIATVEILAPTAVNGQEELPPIFAANAPSDPVASDPAFVDFVSLDTASVGVVGRNIFYNQSKFDGANAAINALDDLAIATDKVAYLPGTGLVGFSSITSYSRGINGIMVDVASSHGTLTQDDFIFRMGANNAPSTWSAAPDPVGFVVRAGAGVSGSDRVEIVWANGAIRNTYLQVIVKGNDAIGGFNTNTGLTSSDLFFFGHRVGDSGTSTPSAVFQTTSLDLAQVFATNTGNAAIVNLRDYDRSGSVTSTDAAIVTANYGTLKRIDIAKPLVFPTRDRPASDLFHWGDAGYVAGFAPNLVKTADGTLLYISEGRSGDFDDTSHAIIMRRSFDNGASWTPVSTIFSVPPKTNKVGSPSVVVDAQTGEVFVLFIRDSSLVFVISSTDSGATWSAPREITQDVKVTEAGNPNPAAFSDAPWNWYAVGSGHGIQLERGPFAGRLLIGADHRLTDNVSNVSWSHVIYSDDHGQTWHLGGGLDPTNPANNYTNENTLVEGNDGSVYMSIRVNNQPYRGQSRSLDGGMTWSQLSFEGSLTRVIVQGTLLRVNESTVLFAAPDSTDGTRAGMTIWVSHNDMLSWVKTKTVFYGYAAYSDMVLVGPDTVLLAFNGGRDNLETRRHTFLVRFNLRSLESPDPDQFTWHFNEKDPGQLTDLGGTSIYDSSPWDNRAIPLANSAAEAPQYVAGPNGHTALRLTSGSDRVTLTPALTRALQFNGNQSFTVELMMRTTDTSGIIIGTFQGIASWTLKLTGGRVQFILDDLVNRSAVTSNQTINDGAWHRVVAVRNAGTHQLTLTIDGVDVSTAPDATTLPLSSNRVMLGSDADGLSQLAFDIDVLRVTRQAITSERWLPAVYPEPPRFPAPNYGPGAPNAIPGLQLWLPSYDYSRFFADSNFSDPLPIEPSPGSAVHSAIDASPNQYRMTSGSIHYSEDSDVGPHWVHDPVSPWIVKDSNGNHEHNFDFVQNTGKFTLSTFIKPAAFNTSYLTLFDTAEAALGQTGFTFKVFTNGSVSLTINGADGLVRFNQISAPGLISTGVWYHVAVVGNGPGNPVTIYVTPITSSTVSAYQLGSTITGSDGIYPTDANHDLFIGGRSNFGWRVFTGEMVDQAIYDRALTSAEIQQLFLYPNSDVVLIGAGGLVSTYRAATNTDQARGDALRAALAAATSGDEIHLGPGTYNLDGTAGPLMIPAGVKLTGAGMENTIITSARSASDPGMNSNSYIVPSGNCVFEDFTIQSPLANNYAYLMGRSGDGDTTQMANVVCRRVKFLALNTADAFYMDNGTQFSSASFYDCQFYSGWDCMSMLGSNASDTYYAENCYFETIGTGWSGSPNGRQGNIANVASAFTAKDCLFKVRGDASGNTLSYGISTTDGANVLDDCHFDVSVADGTVADFHPNSGGTGTFTVSGGSGSGTNGALTTWNVTPIYVNNSLASSMITATAPLTIADTTSATLVADHTIAIPAASGAPNSDLQSRQALTTSPLTRGGDSSADRTTTNSNSIPAGPTSGSAAAASSRAMVSADVAQQSVGVSLTGAQFLNKRKGNRAVIAAAIQQLTEDAESE